MYLSKHLFKFSRSTAISLLSVSLLAVSACAINNTPSPKVRGKKINVVASTSVWGSVAKAVGGDGVEVKSILTEKTPRLEDNPEALNLTKKAQVAVLNGGKFDESVAKIFKSENSKQKILNATKISGTQGDKQLFFSIDAVKAVAIELNNTFSKVAPENKSIFEANLQNFTKKLDDLKIDAQEVGHEHPDTTVLDPSGSTDLLLKTMEIKNLDTNGNETKMLDLISRQPPKMLIISKDPQNNVASQKFKKAAKEAHLPVVLVYSVLPEGTTTYYDFMRNTIEAIHTGIHK